MCTIDEVIINKEGFRPVLVDFQNGKIKSGEEDDLESAICKAKENKTIVGVANSKMLYTGIVENENELYNNFILIHNRKKDKIRLVQIDYCTVSPLLDKKPDVLDSPTKPAENSMSELNKQFGSKKTKRYTEQQERLKMNISTIKDQLEKTVSDIKLEETDLNPVPSENDSLYRPKINRSASTREQVYNLDDLVPKLVLNSLSNEAQNIMNEDIEDFSLTPFSSANISRILTSSLNETKIQKVAIFLYINYLVKFINTPMKNITKRFVVCDKSTEVNNHILDNYSVTTGHSRTRPLLMKDKALCFILVLAAIAMDYEVDVEPLSKDLRIGIKKVMEISRVLAFSPLPKNKSTIILKLPLPAPVSLSPKRKRK